MTQQQPLSARAGMSEPLTDEELNQLAVYSAERERGLVHNLQWVMKMQELQERHDAIREHQQRENHYRRYLESIEAMKAERSMVEMKNVGAGSASAPDQDSGPNGESSS